MRIYETPRTLAISAYNAVSGRNALRDAKQAGRELVATIPNVSKAVEVTISNEAKCLNASAKSEADEGGAQ